MELREQLQRLEKRRVTVLPETVATQTDRLRSLTDALKAPGDRVTIKLNRKRGDPVIEATVKGTGLSYLATRLHVSLPTGVVVRGHMHNLTHPIEITVNHPSYLGIASTLAERLKKITDYRNVEVCRSY